jgi:hypothetical protein
VLVPVGIVVAAVGASVAVRGLMPRHTEHDARCRAVPTTISTGEPMRGDVDADGCDDEVAWDSSSGEVRVSQADRRTLRFAAGGAGDQAVVGDWDCDGVDTLAVYRPNDGAVAVFAGWPDGATPELRGAPVASGVVHGTIVITPGGAGDSHNDGTGEQGSCDRPTVLPAPSEVPTVRGRTP